MDSDDQGLVAPGAALLLIIGEPFSEDQKTLILAEITKGFRCWDVEDTGININEELAQIANRASLGEEGANGERLIQHSSENLAVEILINPLAQSVKNSIKKLLIASSPTKYIIYAGHAFQGSGAWVLQDDTFAFSNLAQVFKNMDVENALKQNIEANLTIHTLADSNWGTCISKADFTNNLRIQLNPPEKLDNIHGVLQFTAYVGSFVKVVPITSLLQASEQFGNISFTRPTLYIFPGCQGDSALFGINGFNLLVNGGYNRRACFWDFARHLDRVDAMLMTHLGTDNIFGLNTVLERKSMENIHPQIGYLYFNALDKPTLPLDGEGDASPDKSPNLLINLAEEATKLTQMSKQLGISPHPCTRTATTASCEPVNLYHKLGHGSLDMYILNPVADSKELKEFYQLWGKQSANLGSSGPFPLQNVLSVCTLLVWKPYNFDEKIVRILFPGSAPQHKLIEGLEKMKTFGFLKHATCTTRDLMKPPPVKKPLGGSAKPSSAPKNTTAKGATSSRGDAPKNLNSTRVQSPRKPEPRATPAKTTPTSPTKPMKAVKEDKPKPENKDAKAKPAGAKDEKDAKPKAGAARPTSANLNKTATAGKTSPAKTASPTKSPSPPKASSPAKSPAKTKSAAGSKPPAEPAVAAALPDPVSAATNVSAGDQVNHVDQEKLQPESDQAHITQEDQVEALQTMENNVSGVPEPAPLSHGDFLSGDVMSGSVSAAVDKQKLEEFGIFEEQRMHQTNGVDSYEADEEEVKPQALPEPPVIVESPCEEHPHEHVEEKAGLTLVDPAQEIPPSPEPAEVEQQDYQPPASEAPPCGFETPVFSNEGPEPEAISQPSLEQNIQYGIDDSSRARDMGGIQEEDEEEHEDDGSISKDSDADAQMDKEALRQMGIYDDEEEEEDGFHRDCNLDDEEIKQTAGGQQDGEHDEEEEEVTGDSRTSAERQFEDVEDESSLQQHSHEEEAEDNSSLPAAFDKDSSPEADTGSQNDGQDEENEQDHVGDGDRDSIDGGTPDDDKDIDEAFSHKMNGDVSEHSAETDMGKKSVDGAALNPFIGVSDQNDHSSAQKEAHHAESDDELQGESFDPVAQWGHPMGLPSPPPASTTKASGDAKKGPTSPQKPNGTDKRPTSAAASKTSRTAGSNGADAKKRPATAPASSQGAARPGTASKRPGTGSSRSSPLNTKMPPLPPMTPFYVDLTYIPNHGDPAYSDAEFFKRVRARYYVISSLSPNPQVLDSLMEAKATWDQKDLEVTLIPTYDNETLRHWMGLNKEKLQELRIDMTPSVSRCTIQLQDLETSLPAYRLEV